METPDFDLLLADMTAPEVNQRWQNQMADFFDIPEGTHADDRMRPIPEVFHLE